MKRFIPKAILPVIAALSLNYGVAKAQSIEWQPKNVVEHVADSASGESLEGVSVDYRNLEESVPFGAENYSFLTDNFGEDAQEVMVQRKITSVGEMTVSDSYGIGVNQEEGVVRVRSQAPINSFSVFDITGRELLQQKVHDNDGFEEFSSELQNLEKGNYIGIATDDEGNRNVTQFITGINGWQTSKGYNPTQKSNNLENSRKKKTLENEVTTAYERVFAKEGFKQKKDTIFLNYNNGKDTILNNILAKIPDTPEYNRRVTVYFNAEGKNIPTGTIASLDELQTSVVGDSAVFNYVTDQASETKSLNMQLENYEDITNATIIVDEDYERVNQNVIPKEFYSDIKAKLVEQNGLPLANALVNDSYQTLVNDSYQTDANGEATFTRLRPTNQFNETINDTINIAFKPTTNSRSFEEATKQLIIDQANENITDTTYSAYLANLVNNGTAGMSVAGYKNGTILFNQFGEEIDISKPSMVLDSLQLSAAGKQDSTIYNKTINEGSNPLNITLKDLPPTEYDRRVAVYFNADGKNIPTGTIASLDELQSSVVGDSAVFTYKTLNPNETKRLDMQLSNYEDIVYAQIIVDENYEKINQNVNPIEFYSDINVKLVEQNGLPLANALVNDSYQTDANGEANFTRLRPTNQFNETINDTIQLNFKPTATSRAFEETSKQLIIDQANETISDTAYSAYNASLTNQGTPGMSVAGYKEGTILFDQFGEEVNIGAPSIVLDSILYTKEGLKPTKKYNQTINEGNNQTNITLQQYLASLTNQGTAGMSVAGYKEGTILFNNFGEEVNIQAPNTVLDSLQLSAIGKQDSTIYNKQILEGENTINITLKDKEYERKVAVYFNANGKNIPTGTIASLDELQSSVVGDSAVFNYKTTNPNETKNLNMQLNNYEDIVDAQIIVDEDYEKINQNVNPIEYYSDINVKLVEQNGIPLANALVNDNYQTNANGEATFTRLRPTNQFNETINDTIQVNFKPTATSRGFEETSKQLIIDSDTETVSDTAYSAYLANLVNNGTAGMNVAGYKEGAVIFNNFGEEIDITKPSTTLDSLKLSATGKQDSTIYNKTINEGSNPINVVLKDEEQPNTVDLYLVASDHTADSVFNSNNRPTKGFVITPQGEASQFFPFTTDTVQHIVLEGYDNSTPISISHNSINGFEENIGTIVKSYQRPITSNSNPASSISTTISDIENDTAYVLFLGKNVNDTVFMHVNGGKEWNHMEYNPQTGKEERTMHLVAINQRFDYDHTNGITYYDDLTAEEKQGLTNRLEFMLQGWETKSGYKILRADTTTQATRTAADGEIEIFYWKDAQVSNYHSTNGEPNTYNNGVGFAESMSWASQFSAEAEQARNYVEDVYIHPYGTTVNDLYKYDEETDKTNHTDRGLETFRINFTYKGGEAPNPE